MRIVYISTLPFADSDLPLIREMQSQEVDIYYLICLECFTLKASLFNIKEQYKEDGIYSASLYNEFRDYDSYFDISKVYVINRTHKSAFHPKTILLQFKTIKFINELNPDIIHITFPLDRTRLILYALKNRMVLTLHDPFLHSGKDNKEVEFYRRLAFKYIKRIIMLNDNQVFDFCEYYNYPQNQILISHIGEYDYLYKMDSLPIDGVNGKYVLFFGLISSYKGVEYLLKAFDDVHKQYPDVKLVIAGGGRLYFDKSLYENRDYVIIKNRYITIQELSWLLKHSMFAVLPYKDATQSGVVQTAFSTSTPLIVTNVGALPDTVTDGETGIVVPPMQSNEIRDAIIHLMNNPDEIKRMKKNIDTVWRPKMSWKPIVKQYMEFYQSMNNKI